MDLDKLRKGIDTTDSAIIRLLAERRGLVQEVIRAKLESGKALRDERREEQLLGELIAKGRKEGLDAYFVTRVFHEVIDDSVRSQQQFLVESANEHRLRKVGFQGIDGAYSHLAAQKFFSKDLEHTTFKGFVSFERVVEALEDGRLDCAFLPIENTTAGSINEVYDLLSRAEVSIVGEEIFRVDHCLLGHEDAEIADLRQILSHPQAIAQCMRFLTSIDHLDVVPHADTAMAVERVQKSGDRTQAAIASEEAGQKYGLKVLKRHLADQRYNYTRFLVIARQPIKVDLRIPCKTSLILATSHEEGCLLKALLNFHSHKINLSKLESRPRPGMPFQYIFYIDLEGNLADDNVHEAISALRPVTTFLKILGSYPVEQRGKTAPHILSLVRPETATTTNSVGAPVPSAPGKTPSQDGGGDESTGGRTPRRQTTTVLVRGRRVGGDDLIVFAGPKVVESREQIFRAAREVREVGGQILRGACFSTHGRAGLGARAVDALVDAGVEYDLPVMTEINSPAELQIVSERVDVLQIGAQHMQNLELLAAVGKANRPVLLERDVMSTIDDFLAAAERIVGEGNHQVILCERGVRSFESTSRNVLDLASISLLKERTHLPVVIDPSYAVAGPGMLVPLTVAARAMDPHGMVLELRENDSDGPHGALPTQEFSDLMRRLYGG